ncbi:hypothetical protein [Nocardia terpenica]|uniref:Uncharacterized protein n=1 Tax=Nocardia terpenica TaxID=455432 RepID=A0A6G9Z8G9_9NOCA|nr:hypothetical protein [Nocardia terpenica]QIS21681.1 hypothetical protein F6W96_28415 [Nocardia terpenica]
MEGALPESSLERLLLHRAFLAAVIKSIGVEIRNRINTTFWKRLKRVLAGASLDELFEGLDDLLADAERSNFESVLGSYAQKGKASSTHKADREASSSAKITLSGNPSINSSLSASRSYTVTASDESEYVDVLMRSFEIKKYIIQLKELLEKFKIEKLYVFIDDFSELPPQAMQIVVDVLLAPLNNWSDELVKFKIAAYPGRIYYGQIDKSKVDEINLDLYALYGTGDIVGMEDKAVDFTRRLIERRLEHYAQSPANRFFAIKGQADLWRQLFYATMANPRNLGYLLFFACEAAVIYNRPISSRVVRDAARRYYEEKVNAYFEMNRFLLESFDERSSIFKFEGAVGEYRFSRQIAS